MNAKIKYIKDNKGKWVKKTEIAADNKIFKVIGVGPKAFKVLWFGPTPGTVKPVWNQCWWNYDNLDTVAKEVVGKMYTKMKGGN